MLIQETSFYSEVIKCCRINEIIVDISRHLPAIAVLVKEKSPSLVTKERGGVALPALLVGSSEQEGLLRLLTGKIRFLEKMFHGKILFRKISCRYYSNLTPETQRCPLLFLDPGGKR